MRPMIPDKSYYRLTIPELSGGVNLRDGISLVADNQLTDCKNVWYKDGMLRTRPGMRTSVKESFGGDYIYNYLEGEDDFKAYTDGRNYRVIDGITYFLVCLQYSDKLIFYYYTTDSEAENQFLEVSTINEIPADDFTCNIFQHGTDIYCFCSGYYGLEETPFYIFKISEDEQGATWSYERITQDKIYAPLVMINGLTHPTMHPYEDDAPIMAEGDYLEGYNLLGNRYRISYHTVNKELFNDDGSEISEATQPAYYELLHPVKEGDKITVEVTLPTNNPKIAEDTAIRTFTHEVTIGSNGYGEEVWDEKNPSLDGLYISVMGRKLELNDGHTKNTKYFSKEEFIDYNNLVITAPCPNSKENYEKVLNMTFNEWYGGNSEGLYGGIHLFMGGNTNHKEESLVVWCDLNNPLYFSENCYSYVGDTSQRVTAFGKQGEALIIAKEKEMYATQYNSMDNTMKAEDIKSQSIVDVAASEVTFPMVQVHGFIGCDCPKTMQLCRNRLVWTNSDGKVYTLVSASQYNERSIYEVSGMIENRLKKYAPTELRNARAADWEGYYVLIIKNDMYLMDYNSYGFSNVYSYTKTEDAQSRIPWWIWEIPTLNLQIWYEGWEKVDIRSVISISGKLYMIILYKTRIPNDLNYAFAEIVYFEEKGDGDIFPCIYGTFDGVPKFSRERLTNEIPTLLQTKFFDFGLPTIKKSIPKIEASFGTNGGNPIRATVITENAAEENEIVIDDPEEQEYSAGYFQNRLIRPANKQACRVGIKFESDGNMVLDAISLKYKQLGGLK